MSRLNPHRDLKVASSHAKIIKNFANYFLKLKQEPIMKNMLVNEVKWKTNAVQNFKFDPALKVNATFQSSLDLCALADKLYHEHLADLNIIQHLAFPSYIQYNIF